MKFPSWTFHHTLPSKIIIITVSYNNLLLKKLPGSRSTTQCSFIKKKKKSLQQEKLLKCLKVGIFIT